MGNTDYKKDAKYYLTLASSMVDDLSNHAGIVMDEIGQKRADIKDEIDAVGGKVFATGKGLVKGKVKYEIKKRKLKKEIDKEFQLILSILDKSDQLDPNAQLEGEDEEGGPKVISSNAIRALAYYSAGRCYLSADKLKLALEAFGKSHNYVPSQEALNGYAIATKLQGGWGSTSKITEAFEKVVEFDPYSEIGLEAAKQIVRMQ